MIETTKGTPADEYEEYKVEFDPDGTPADATDMDAIVQKEIIEEAKGDAPLIKTFVNTRLAETFETDYVSAMSAEGLLRRCESYEQGVCPMGVLFITQGVDCQIDRLEVSTWGWVKVKSHIL